MDNNSEDKRGTPSARLEFLLKELAKRFPEADKPFQSDPPELRFLKAIDKHLEKNKSK